MTEKEYYAVLSASPLFAGLDRKETDEAVGRMEGRVSSYRKGDFLHAPGTPFSAFGLVLYGSVHACADDVNGNRLIMAEVGAGNTFGEALCFLSVPEPPVYVTAASDAGVLWLSPAPLWSGSTDGIGAGMQKRFAAVLAARTLTMNERIQVLSKRTIREKLTVYISCLTRGLASGPEGVAFTVPLSREDMAAYIGTDRSALSRELSAMKREGLIDYRKNAFLLKKR